MEDSWHFLEVIHMSGALKTNPVFVAFGLSSNNEKSCAVNTQGTRERWKVTFSLPQRQ